MPHNLDSGDRKLLIGAAALLVVLVIGSTLLSPAQSEGMSAYPSSYSTGWGGAKAAYLLLQDLGYRVSRWEQSPTELPQDGSQILILTEPMPLENPSPEEKSAIRNFLQRGGRILATGWGAAELLPEASQFSEGYPLAERTRFHPQLPSPLVRDAPEISMIAPQHWQPRRTSQLVVYGNADTAAVITYSVGQGQVIWWGASSPLTNAGIRESGNLALFLNSVGPANGVHVLWDEYFHGPHGSLWSYFARTPMPWGVAQVGIVFLAVVITYSRRQGPIVVPPAASRLSPLEFVETLGDLYLSAHAGSAAVRIAYQRLRFQLIRQLGLSPNVSDAEMARSAAAALAWNPRAFSDTLNRSSLAMDAARSADADTLKLVQEIFDYSSRLELRGAKAAERQPG